MDGYPPHAIFVAFSPIPGHEEIVSVSRKVTFPQGQKPTYDVFTKALVEKYGTPTQTARNKFLWVYDHNGALRKPNKDVSTMNCESVITQFEIDTHSVTTGWAISLNDLRYGMTLERMIAYCGAVHVAVELAVLVAAANSGDSLVDGHGTKLVGFDAGIRASKEARALIDKAATIATEAAIKKGQQQKPEF